MKNTIMFILIGTGFGTLACQKTRNDALEEQRPLPATEARSELRTNEPSTNEATAVPGSQALAVKQIAEARCQRETRCGNVGPDKDYASEGACVAKIQVDRADDLNLSDCPGGIVQKELSECLEEIKNDNCDNPLDTLGRIAACRESDLCKAM